MTRFNTFNSLMSASSQNDDDEDEEPPLEENVVDEEDVVEVEAEEIVSTITKTSYVEKHIFVEVPPESQLETQYTDASYWRVTGNEDDLDELMKDFE